MRSALKMSPLASPTECKAELGRLRALYDLTDDPRASVQGVGLGDYTDSLMSLMGMGPSGTLQDLLDCVEEMIDAAIAQHVLERHDGLGAVAGDDDAADMADTTPETTAMSDATTQAINMNDTRIKDLEAKNAELALKLGAAEAKNETLAADVKALKEAHEKRLMSDRDTRVAEAFETYKDSHKLTDASKDMMRVYLETKPEEFDKLYPRVSPRERYLLRDVAPPPPPASPHNPPSGSGPIGAPVDIPTAEELVPKLMRDGMPLEQACLTAEKQIQKALAARRAA
jgi:hypothetical protein